MSLQLASMIVSGTSHSLLQVSIPLSIWWKVHLNYLKVPWGLGEIMWYLIFINIKAPPKPSAYFSGSLRNQFHSLWGALHSAQEDSRFKLCSENMTTQWVSWASTEQTTDFKASSLVPNWFRFIQSHWTFHIT